MSNAKILIFLVACFTVASKTIEQESHNISINPKYVWCSNTFGTQLLSGRRGPIIVITLYRN